MTAFSYPHFRNGERIDLEEIPRLKIGEFRNTVIQAVHDGGRLLNLFAETHDEVPFLVGIISSANSGGFIPLLAPVDESYPSLTPDCPQAHLFEREIFEECDIRPDGHPWLKPVRYTKADSQGRRRCAVTEFFQTKGEEVHEVAVGPVHAGIIEPGHFRFQCHGEKVFHLEIALGFQHRGIENALIGGPGKITPHYMETLAGDTTIGHSLTYAQAVEALSGCRPSARAQALRGIALELERIANHVGDLGALAGDIGYLPTASFCGRIRGDFLNMTALLCGNRFGRGLIRPGGIAFDLDDELQNTLADRIKNIFPELTDAVSLLWHTPSVLARFEETGKLSRKTCEELGLVGPAARACGLERDVRFEFPSGIFSLTHLPLSTWSTGDVFARAYVRWLEIQRSKDFILDQLKSLPGGDSSREVGSPAPDSMVVTLAEGWRGEICHTVITDEKGRFARYKIVDPSFHNWTGLAMVLRDGQISDFPLCNKSFNLSYCGHDL